MRPTDDLGALLGVLLPVLVTEPWVVHPDGSGLRRVTTAVNRDLFVTPVWSPDSTKLLLNKVDRNNQASVWTVNLDGSGLVHLADTPQPSILDWGSAPAN